VRTHLFERGVEALVINPLQQIIERARFEGADRVLV
jgi:hypothetical protein